MTKLFTSTNPANEIFTKKFENTSIIYSAMTTEQFASLVPNEDYIPLAQRHQKDYIPASEMCTQFAFKYVCTWYAFIQKIVEVKQVVEHGSVNIVCVPSEEAIQFMAPTPDDKVEEAMSLEEAFLSLYVMDGMHRLLCFKYLLENNGENFWNAKILDSNKISYKQLLFKEFCKEYEGMTMREVNDKLLESGIECDLFKEFKESIVRAEVLYSHNKEYIGATLPYANSGRRMTNAGMFNALSFSTVTGKAVQEFTRNMLNAKRNMQDWHIGETKLSKLDVALLKKAYHVFNSTSETVINYRLGRYNNRLYEVKELLAAVEAIKATEKKSAVKDAISKLFASDSNHLGKEEVQLFINRYNNFKDTKIFEELVELFSVCQPVAHIFKSRNFDCTRGQKIEKTATHDNELMSIMFALYFLAKGDMNTVRSYVKNIQYIMIDSPETLEKALVEIANLEAPALINHTNYKADNILSLDSHFGEKRDRYLYRTLPIVSKLVTNSKVVNW